MEQYVNKYKFGFISEKEQGKVSWLRVFNIRDRLKVLNQEKHLVKHLSGMLLCKDVKADFSI